MKKIYIAVLVVGFLGGNSYAMDDYCREENGRELYLAALDGNIEGVRSLLNEDVDVNWPLGLCGTPLHAAVRNGNIAMVNLLLKYGANPNTLNEHNQSALDSARSQNQQIILGLMVQAINQNQFYESRELDLLYDPKIIKKRKLDECSNKDDEENNEMIVEEPKYYF